jgi:hypothetical protein
MDCTVTYERSISIPIQKTTSFENKELGLNHTFIDPTKISPPNSFMDKLAKRMDNYYSPIESDKKSFFTKS